MAHCAFQVAAAVEVNQAETSQALSKLADSGYCSSSAVATAVHNCRYRPYIARQVITSWLQRLVTVCSLHETRAA